MVDRAAGEKGLLHTSLQKARDVMLWKLEGLADADLRRPMTPTGTNLLGLVKHLAGVEYGYFGDTFGRPAPERMSWVEDGTIWQGADMWAKPDESVEYITGLYRRACTHADQTIAELDLDDTGTVPWWGEGKQEATLRRLLVRMIDETARHAGHADIVRELVDGSAGHSRDNLSIPPRTDEAWWRTYLEQVRGAAAAMGGKSSGIGRLGSVVLEARDPYALASFYSELLGLPMTRVDGDPPASWVDIGDATTGRMSFQYAPEHQPPSWPDSTSSMQFHLDIDVDDIEKAEQTVLASGATRLPWDSTEEEARGLRPEGHGGFRIYADPAGHPFCLVWS